MNIKKVIIPIVVSIICGGICGGIVYNIYKEKIENTFDSTKVFLLQTGAYSSEESMRKNSNLANYIYYNDDGLYKTVLAITKNKELIKKISNAYGDIDVVINEYYLNDEELNNTIKTYDERLNNEMNENEIQRIVDEMLNLYKEDNSVKLLKMY